MIVFALADLLAGQDDVVIDKGLPPVMREGLTLRRTVLRLGKRQ